MTTHSVEKNQGNDLELLHLKLKASQKTNPTDFSPFNNDDIRYEIILFQERNYFLILKKKTILFLKNNLNNF